MTQKLLLAIMLALCANQAKALNYFEAKQNFEDKYKVNLGADGAYRLQNLKSQNVSQLFITPYLRKNISDNKYGKTDFDFSMNIVRFGGQKPADTASRYGIATLFNSYDADYTELYELYFSYTLPSEFKRITIGAGQIPVSKFDSPTTSDLQSYDFLNSATSQNTTFIYPTAGIGAYAQVELSQNVTASMGAADASNPLADGIRLSGFGKNSYFTSVHYTPNFYNRYKGSYSLLLYSKPHVKKAPYSGQGWSLYFAQDVSDKHSLFLRINGATGNNVTVNGSYSVGWLWLNPFNRPQNDKLGVAYSVNKINKKATDDVVYNRYEHITEAYYDYKITENFSLLSDAQLYLRRGFAKTNSPAAVVSLGLNLSL